MNTRTWYSVFVSPSWNVHYFTLELPDEPSEGVIQTKMRLVADRLATDKKEGQILDVTYRAHVEFHESFVAVLAKDNKTPSDGLNVMVLKQDSHSMDGTFTWNSLTGGTIRSEKIHWTSTPSESHRRMTEPQPC